MLDISISLDGDKVIIQGLQKLADDFFSAIQRGLTRSAISVHRLAYQWLSGSGSVGKGRGRNKWGTEAGGYPVPVRTGWLRRMLDWLKPGESKTGDAGTFRAAANEAVVYDSALYANALHEGKGSSAKFGPRRFITDAFEMFNRSLGVKMAIWEEIQITKRKAGLA
jgi:hypothetical protein